MQGSGSPALTLSTVWNWGHQHSAIGHQVASRDHTGLPQASSKNSTTWRAASKMFFLFNIQPC